MNFKLSNEQYEKIFREAFTEATQKFMKKDSFAQQLLNKAADVLESKTASGKKRLVSPSDLGTILDSMGDEDTIPNSVRHYLADLTRGDRPEYGSIKLLPNWVKRERDIRVLFDYIDIIHSEGRTAEMPKLFHREEYLTKKYRIGRSQVNRILQQNRGSINKLKSMQGIEKEVILTIVRTCLSMQKEDENSQKGQGKSIEEIEGMENCHFLRTIQQLLL